MPAFPRKRAIVIGVDDYEEVKKLTFCGHDARDIAKAFRESLQFKPEDVLQLTLDSPLKPDRTGIIREFGRFLQKEIEEDELLLFYFSGHGIRDPKDKQDYLLPVDASLVDAQATGIAVQYFIDKLKATRCKNIVMFIDACREELEEGAKAISGLGESSRAAVEREGVVTFFSCDPKERSYEIEDLGHGSFTYCMLQAIEKGDYPTVEKMDKYLRNEVPLINQKHGKPVQLPFTIIEPAEKSDLNIFYSEIKQEKLAEFYNELYQKLADLYTSDQLDDKIYNDAGSIIETTKVSPVLSPEDTLRMKYVQSLASGKLSPRAFREAWNALERREIKLSAPAKPL
jgi:uncharacterized caspase-like protein